MPVGRKDRHVGADFGKHAFGAARGVPYVNVYAPLDDVPAFPRMTDELTLPDVAAWRVWLEEHHTDQDGIWLVLAKKGTTEPTTLTYEQALQEALCYGWIDGQARRRDEATHVQRFTPRRRQSPWSQRNVARVERLTQAGRMQPAGLAEIERAKADGRWDAAYAGSAGAETPHDLTTALAANPAAQAMFDILTRTNRFAILHRIGQAKRPETRARRIEQYVAMLARGETIYPQRRTLDN
jgi:uncharacterized protein YdeI (YjbR/CyaY-like superfamily)